jgi:transcriptional regulator with XRE-family HTH domain
MELFLLRFRVPRKTPLPESEKAICKRLSAIRKFSHLNQDELARMVGTTTGLIANVEAGRSPLKAGLALSICKSLKVNPRWLAEGVGPPKLIDDSLVPLLDKCDSPVSRFSAFYSRRLKPFFLKLDAYLQKESDELKQSVPDILEKIKNREIPLTRQNMDGFRRLLAAFLDLKAAQETVKQTTEGVNSIMSISSSLTHPSNSYKTVGVKSPLASLRARLNKLTAQSGKKSELADYLGAPLASVSRWLSGDREPGGEITLKMLHWVELQERK